jgi:LDH2 family malate/lactate/ureidoglycolate dehydrogenase
MRFELLRLSAFVQASLRGFGVPNDDATVVADSIIDAELTGQVGHGMVRLPFLLRRLRDNLIAPNAAMRVTRDIGAAAILDAGNGLGPVAGVKAVGIAAAKARASGIGLCAVRRSNHLGAMGFYVEPPARDGLFVLGFSNTPPAMAPPGGKTAVLGTNPIAAGIPSHPAPLVIDLATTQVARGRILKASRAREQIPEGWATDSEGRATTDPDEAIKGSLVPIGGPKGFALALLVESLSGVLAGAGIGPEVGGTYVQSDRESNVGHSFLAIDATGLDPAFADRVSRLTDRIRSVEPLGETSTVRVPGDRRRRDSENRLREGIDVADNLVEELQQIAGTNI